MSSELAQALKTLQGFNALGDAALEQIIPFASVRLVRAGETIFCQGEPSPFFFGVLSGEIMIQHISKDGQFPSRVLGIIESSGLFGESSLFEDMLRMAMATASKDGKLAVIRGQELREWMRQNPEAAQPLLLALLRTLHTRLRQTNS